MRIVSILLISLVVLQACGTGGRDRPAPVGEHRPGPRTPAEAAPAPSVRPYRSGPAAQALLDKARAQQASGDLDAAAATLERALRIERRNPRLWNRLAQVRLAQGRTAEAASFAAKSNALPGADAALRRDNQRILAKARTSP